MEVSFNEILSAAVAPLVLTSGVGLLLLSLVNRYNHAIDRTRQLFNTPKDDQELWLKRMKQVDHLHKRCQILRNSIGILVLGVAFNSLLIFISVIQILARINLDTVKLILLLLSILTIIMSILLFYLDVRLSLAALDIELGKD